MYETFKMSKIETSTISLGRGGFQSEGVWLGIRLKVPSSSELGASASPYFNSLHLP